MKVCKLCKNKKSKKDYQIHSKKTNGEIRLTSRCKSCISIENKKIRDKKYGYDNPLNEGQYVKNCTLHGRLSHENTLIKIRKRNNSFFTASAHCFICIKIKYRDGCIPNAANEYDKKYLHKKINQESLICCKCKIMKSVDLFRKCDLSRRYSKCMECSKQYEYIHHKKLMLKKKYNLSLEQYEKIKIEQKSLCKICGNEETKLHNKSGKPIDLSVDHCHKTGVNRGLLCSSCNIGLGYFKDSPETLRSAADYLDKYNAT